MYLLSMRPIRNTVSAIVLVTVYGHAAWAQAQAQAQAQANGPAAQTFSGFRIGLFSGAFVPDSVNFAGAGAVGGIPISGSGRITSSPGPVLGGFVGYSPDEHINIDLDIGNSWNNFDKFEGTLSVGPFGQQQGKFSLRGDSTITGGFLNATFLPLGIGIFSPYLGGGPGVTIFSTTIRSINLGNTNLQINGHNSELSFAANFLAGIDLRVGDRWEIGLSYQYLWIDSGNLGSSSVLAGHTSHLTGQLVGALFEYHL